MSFLYPAFLLGALAVAVPIVLHLLRRDVAPEVPFTAVRLLRRAPVERSRRRRLRDIVLLAARVAALLLLATAFARPYAAGGGPSGTRVVAIDRSFSMRAPGQFARALEMARAAIDEAGASAQVAVIAFDDHADLLSAPGTAADARRALEPLTAGFGGTRFGPLVERASAAAESGGTLVVISDFLRAGDDRIVSLPAGWRADLRDVGAPPGNLAVTALAVEPGRVVATIRNVWGDARQGRVRVLHDGREIASAPFSAAPGTSTAVSMAVPVPAAGSLAVVVDDPGGIDADDTRYRVLGPAVQPRVLIVAPDGGGRQPGFYLGRALQTGAGERGFDVRIVSSGTLSTAVPDALSEQSAIVLLSTRGLDRRARESVAAYTRAGGGLLLTAGPDLEGAVLTSIFGWQPAISIAEISGTGLTFAATDLRHPVFRPFGALVANLGQVRFDRAWRIGEGGWTVLARFSDGHPALLERIEGNGRVMLFASDLERRWNDFPLHPSFVPFIIETARHAAGTGLLGQDFVPGGTPPGLPATPGVHTAASPRRTIAINVDARESETARLEIDELRRKLSPTAEPAPREPARAADLQALHTEAGQGYWRYGLLLMLAALVAESFVGRPQGKG